MTRLLRLLIISIAFCATPVSAQTMYRCGNAYQDHPCGGGQAGKVIGVGSSPNAASTAAAASRVSAQCSQRGIAAQKIKWIREAGETQQQQLAAASGSADRSLVADVYSRQGTSVEVRAAVEADCMAEQDRAAQAAALLEAANRLQERQRAAIAAAGCGQRRRQCDGVARRCNATRQGRRG